MTKAADIRAMIEDGATDEEIDIRLRREASDRYEAEIEARAYDDFHDAAYGTDIEPISEWNERISMGRNEAGEWRGFM